MGSKEEKQAEELEQDKPVTHEEPELGEFERSDRGEDDLT